MASAHASCRSIAQGLFWLLAGVTVLVRGQPVYLSLGAVNPVITTNNTEVLITDIGDGANPGATTLTCHTDLVACCRGSDHSGTGGLGSWFNPNGDMLSNEAGGGDFYIRRNDAQLIRLYRRNSATSPVGLYCCVIPTTLGEMRFCANLVTSLTPVATTVSTTMATTTMETTMMSTDPTPAVDCGPPPSITNGSPGTPTSTTLGGTVTYTCDSGYILSGSATVTCLSTGFWSTRPTCTALLRIGDDVIAAGSTIPMTNVGPGGLIERGLGITPLFCSTTSPSTAVWLFPDGTIVPPATQASFTAPSNTIQSRIQSNLISLHRGDGFIAPAGQYCCGSATNVNERLCVTLASCPLLDLTNGMVTYTDPPINGVHNSFTATHTCSNGYQLVGDSIRICDISGDTGTWGGADRTCIPTCNDLPTLTNGVITYNPNTSPRLEGTTATHNCNNGYELSGGTVRTCQSDRAWSGGSITCQPVTVDCGPPPSITNGSPGTPTSTTFGGTVTYSCNDGLIISGSAMITCLASGSWSTLPSCTAVDCGPLSDPVNGQVTTSGTTFNSMATYSCDEGFNLVGSRAVTCWLDGVWTPSSPTCDAVDCGPPPSITNGSPTTPASTTFRETIVYSCSDGYIILGSTTITCLSTGSWSSPPICQPLPPVYLSLSVTKYISGISEIPLSSVGEGAGSYLTCRTDDTNCCREAESGVVGGIGAWHYPNGSVVPTSSDGGDLYISRDGPMVVNLNRRNDVMGPTGLYCCVVPTSTGTGVFCANLSGPSIGPPRSQSDNTGAIVGGVVVILLGLGLILAVTAVIIAYLVLKQRRTGGVNLKRDPSDIPLSDKGQSAPPQTLETVDVTYEEIGGTRPLKVNCDYTQNQAYVTTTAPLRGEGVVNTGGSGNPTEVSPVGGDESMIYEN